MPSVDSLISKFQAEDSKKQALATSAVQAYDTNPDQQVYNMKLAQQAGIPAAIMPEATDDAKMRVLINRMQQTADDSPATANFLTNPDNAKIAHDDVNNLSGMEQVFSGFAGIGAKIMSGLASNEAVGTKAMNIIAQGRRLLNQDSGGQFQKDLQEGSSEATQRVKDNVKYWDDIAHKYGQDDSVGARIIGGLAKGIAGLPAGIVGFNPVFGSLSAAAETAEKPGSNGLDVISSGTAEAIKLKGLAKIFHAIEGTGLGTAGKMAVTGGAMGTQTAAEIAGSQGIGALTSPQGLEEVATSLVTGAALGYNHITGEQDVIRKNLIASGVDAGEANQIARSAQTIYPFVNDLAAAHEAKITKDFFEALGDAAGNTKLIERLPEKMREYVTELKKDGPIDNVYVPADKWQEYWQTKQEDPAAMAEHISGDPEQYKEALATGGDIVIPLEDFVSKLAQSEHYKGLSEDIKIRPGAMTAREAAEFEKDLPARLEELKGKINEGEAQDVKARSSQQKVFDDVYGQMQGIFPRDTAEKYATLAAVRAKTRAARLGKDPWDLYNERPLKISQSLPDALRFRSVDMGLDPDLDRLRSGNIPTESAVNGTSLGEFLRDRGLTDPGGELTSMEVDGGLKPFQKKMIRKGGLDPDKARELAVEQGYLPEGSTTADLFDAIDREQRGRPVYSPEFTNHPLMDDALKLNQLKDHLDRAGVDLNTMDNAAVREHLKGQQELFQEAANKAGNFRTSLKEYFAKTLNPKNVIEVGVPSSALKEAGVKGEKILLKQSILNRKGGRDSAHEYSYESLASLPEAINDPIMVIDQGDGHKAIFTELKAGGENLLVALETKQSGRDIEVSRIVTMFGKKPEGIAKWLEDGHSVWYNEQKAQDWLAVLQPTVSNRISNLLKPSTNIKLFSDKSVKDSQQQVYYQSESNNGTGDKTRTDTLDVTRKDDTASLSTSSDSNSIQTDTEVKRDSQLKEWFGDSKIVDETGNPQVVYHGTDTNFSKINFKKGSQGLFWFTSDKESIANGEAGAQGSSKVMALYAKIENPAGWKEYDKYSVDELEHLGYDGVILPNSDGSFDGFVFKEPTQIKSADRNNGNYNPTDANIYHQETDNKRGFFRFSDTSPEREIGILEKADLSTFLHETGHSWLEELKDDALRSDAPEQLKQDWETIKKELGVEGDTLTREQHEQWARSTEAYLMEGKAPSAELAGIFSRFKLWLAQIYKTMSGLNVKMTDEVRGVMDRLLASDEEIKRAQDDMGQKPLFVTPEEAGMTAREFEAYRKDAEAGGQKARDVLAGQLMKELKREQETWWKTEKDKVRTEVMDEAKQNPVYVALQEILKGKDFEGNDSPGLKMNRDELVKRYGEDFVKKLPKGSATEFLYAKEGGIDPDLLAEKYGFSSGDEMIRKMMETPSLKRFVSAEADLRMKERNGDMRLDGSIADEAMNAIHNDHWAEVLRAEIKALKRKANDVKPYVDAAIKDATEQAKKDAEATARWTDAERKQKEDQDRAKRNAAADRIPPVSTFREAARQQIGAKIVKELAPHLYLNAERKAAREAFEANGKGDYEKAADARIKQMLNHFLYAESVKAKEAVDIIQKYAVKMSSAKELGKMGKAGQDFLDQIQGILNRYSFDKISNKEADIRQEHRESLDAFLTRLADPDKGQGIDLPIPDAIRMEIQQENYRNMPVDDLKAVYDSMRMLEHVAKRINSVNAEGKRVEITNAAMSLANRLFRSIKGKPDMERKSDKAETLMDKVKDVNADIAVMLPEFMFNRFDGNKKTGEWHEYIWDRYNDAADHQIRLRESIFPKIMEFAHGDKIDRSKGKIYIEGIKASLVKDDIIAIALNCGNESNMDKLMRGGLRFKGDDMGQPLDHDQLKEILSHLTKDEIDVVNGIWKTIESLKPEAAALARKRTGIEPKWIEAQPMEIKNGTLEGGYYPVKYDSRYSAAGEKQSDSSTLDQMFNKFASTSTRQGYMKERTNAAYPMSLDWQSIVSRHLDEVITDISHWEFASDTQRLLKRPEVKDAILDRLGNSYYKNLLDWVKYTVNQDNVSPEASDSIEQFRRKIRSNMSTFVLGFKVTNAMAEMAIGIPLMTQHVKFESAFKGVMQYMRNPKEATQFAVEASDYMKNLDKEFDRNVTEALQDLAGKHTVIDDIRSWSIASRVFFWKIGATMAWHAGYQDAMSQGLQGKAAVRVADSIYRMTQESGRAGDLSAVQRNPYMKEMTMFIGPTLIQYNNIARSARAFKDQGLNKDTAKLGLTTLMCGIVANQILFEVLRGKTPDEKDKIPAWIMARLTLGLVDGFPILRDVAGYAEGKILGEHGKDMKLAPVFQFGKDVVDGASKTIKAASGEGDWQKAIVQDAKVIGGATGLPTLQGSITGQYLYDVLSGNYTPEHPWSPATDIFYARKKH